MKNIFALSALLFANFIHASEASSRRCDIPTCLEEIKEASVECNPIGAIVGTLTFCAGIAANYSRSNRPDESNFNGDPISHNIEKDFYEEEDICAECAPKAGAICVFAPLVCYTCSLCALNTYRCCYDNPNPADKED